VVSMASDRFSPALIPALPSIPTETGVFTQ
jgi:hypothetical protein